MSIRIASVRPLLVLALALAGAAGCGSDNGNRASYEVTVANLTHNQPFTAPVAVLHGAGFQPWAEGEPARTPLERLAEGGVTDAFVQDARGRSAVSAAAAAAGGVGPGEERTLTLKANPRAALRLSVVTMLARTNDAFTGRAGQSIGDLGPGESMMVPVGAWDAGTEADTETAATVPGLGGEGFSATRDDDLDRVTVHPGVVTADDGLATSDLTEADRFIAPVARIRVTRLQ